MAYTSIYLGDSLRERVRRAGLPVSRICQQALLAELDERGERGDRYVDPAQLRIDAEMPAK